MPGISDPGFRLVSLAIEHGVPVIPIPGASAFLLALVASGFPTDSFAFNGFLPSKRGQRRQILEKFKSSEQTQAFYEAPHRIIDTLEDVIEAIGPQRQVVVAREVTKLYEEFLRGKAQDVLENLKARDEVRGEITLVIGKAEDFEQNTSTPKLSLKQRLQQIMDEDKLDEKAALKKIAKELGISKSEAYREWQRSKLKD